MMKNLKYASVATLGALAGLMTSGVVATETDSQDQALKNNPLDNIADRAEKATTESLTNRDYHDILASKSDGSGEYKFSGCGGVI